MLKCNAIDCNYIFCHLAKGVTKDMFVPVEANVDKTLYFQSFAYIVQHLEQKFCLSQPRMVEACASIICTNGGDIFYQANLALLGKDKLGVLPISF